MSSSIGSEKDSACFTGEQVEQPQLSPRAKLFSRKTEAGPQLCRKVLMIFGGFYDVIMEETALYHWPLHLEICESIVTVMTCQ